MKYSDTDDITAVEQPQMNPRVEFQTRVDHSGIKRCPIWALVHALTGKSVGASDRCSPGCHLYLGEAGDCSFKIIARYFYNAIMEAK